MRSRQKRTTEREIYWFFHKSRGILLAMQHAPVEPCAVEKLWPPAAVDVEDEFQRCTGEVVSTLLRARLQGDATAAQQLFDCLAAAREHWTREPQASILDNAYAQACRSLSDWAVCDHRLEQSLELAALGWRVLERKNRRREMMGLKPAPSTAVRIQLLGGISDAKWRLGERHQDDILAAAGHAPLYLMLANRVRDGQTAGTVKAEQYPLLALGLLWTGLWVAAMQLRFHLPGLEDVASECNTWHAGLLGHKALMLGHGVPAPGVDRSPWFWHFEIVKVFVDCKGGVLPAAACREQLDSLYHELETAVHKCPQFFPDVAYQQSLQRDREWMERSLGRDSVAGV
jgi:hypothetical protein